MAEPADEFAYGRRVCDAGAGWASKWGVGGSPFISSDQHSAAASVTDAPLVATAKLVIDDIFLAVDTTMNVIFKEETSGTILLGPLYMLANTSLQLTPRGRLKLFTANKKLQVITSVSGNIMVMAGYHSEP